MFEDWTAQNWVAFLVFWVVLNSFPTWLTIYSERRLLPNPERDAKFQPWVCKDRPRWSYFWLTFGSCFNGLRTFVGWCCVLGCVIVANLVDCRRDVETEVLSNTRRTIIQASMAFFARCHSYCGGCMYASVKRVECDYSLYLGPDYKYRYDKVGIHVCNHLHMYDIICGIYLQWFGGYQASFIGKRELVRYPLLGKLVTPLESVLVGRD